MTDDKPDFEALRAQRNKTMQRLIDDFAREFGCPTGEVRSTFNPNACYCDCASGGPCEHKWDGEPYTSEDGCTWSATCSRCGTTAMSHSMRVGL